MHIKSPAGAFKQILVALDTLYKSLNDAVRTEWNDRAQRLLTGQAFNNLLEIDPLADIRGDFATPETEIKRLNQEQRQTVTAMGSAPLGVQLIHGPPGTGKSYLIVQLVLLFLQAKELKMIPIVSPANDAVNSSPKTLAKISKCIGCAGFGVKFVLGRK